MLCVSVSMCRLRQLLGTHAAANLVLSVLMVPDYAAVSPLPICFRDSQVLSQPRIQHGLAKQYMLASTPEGVHIHRRNMTKENWRAVVGYLGTRRHDWTCRVGAKFLKRPKQNADGIVEVHSIHSKPLIQILAWWQLHCFSDIATAKGSLYVALEC